MRILSSRWFRIGISLGLFVVLLQSTDLRAFNERLTGVQLKWVLLAYLGYLFGQVVSAYKWRLLARPLGFVRPLGAFVAYYFVGMYLNLFAPSTVAGDFGRSALLAEDRGSLGLALQSVVADRISGLVMLLWVSAFGACFIDAEMFPPLWRYGVVTAAVGALLAWWIFPRFLDRIFHVDNKIRRFFDKLIGPYQNAPGVLVCACGLSLGFHFFQLSLQVMVAHALSLNVSVWYLVMCIPLVNILSSLPVSFGGFGVREGGYVTFLSLVGIENDQALAFGLLWSAVVFGANATGGLALLLSPSARPSIGGAKKTLAG